MTRKIGLSVGMIGLALVFAAGITAGAMAQAQQSAASDNKPGGNSTFQPSGISDVSDNKPGGASTNPGAPVNNISDNKPGGTSSVQIPASDNPSANKPGG